LSPFIRACRAGYFKNIARLLGLPERFTGDPETIFSRKQERTSVFSDFRLLFFATKGNVSSGLSRKEIYSVESKSTVKCETPGAEHTGWLIMTIINHRLVKIGEREGVRKLKKGTENRLIFEPGEDLVARRTLRVINVNS